MKNISITYYPDNSCIMSYDGIELLMHKDNLDNIEENILAYAYDISITDNLVSKEKLLELYGKINSIKRNINEDF